MKKIFMSVLALAMCSVTSLFAGEVSELYTLSIDKSSLEEGTFDLVGATVFSIEDVDGEESTGLYSFKLSDIKTYPSTVSISMGSAYTEADNTNFNDGGTAAAPRYAITNDARNLDLSKKTATSANRIFFLSPAKNATCFKMSNIHHSAGKAIKASFTFFDYTLRYSTEVSDQVKYQIKAGQAGSTSSVYEFTVTWQNPSKNVVAEFSLQDAGVADFDIEIVRVSDDGAEHICYIQDFYVYSDTGASEILTASALNAVAYYGTEATLMADFKSPVTESALVWEESENGTTFTEMSSFSGQQTITVNPEVGKHFYRVKATAGGKDYQSNIILTTRTMGCAATSKILWSEDFGTLSPETARNSNQYVKSTYSYAASGNVNDGQYAVVANPRTAGSDGGTSESSYWFRSIYDHTQGQPVNNIYGGMLLVNCQAGQQTNDIVMERTVELECKNAFVNFSAWFANAGHDRGTLTSHPINMKICVLNPSNVVLAEINVEAEKSEGWKSGLVSFYNKDWDKLTLRIINNGEGGGGNDVLIDDIEFTICRPDVKLEAQVGGQTAADVTDVRAACGGDVELIADPNGSYSSLYSIADPYYKWLKSTDKSTWTDAGQAGTGETKQKFTVQASSTRTYYKCVIGPDKDAVDAYIQNPTAYSCSSVAEASYASVRCPADMAVSIEQTGCNTYALTFDPAPNSVKWYMGSDDCGWKLLSGVTKASDKYTVTSADIPTGSCKLYFKGVDGDDNTRWAVSSDYAEYSELALKSTLNEGETVGCDLVYDLSAEMKKNGATSPADLYTFKTQSENLIQASSSNKCQVKSVDGYTSGYYKVEADMCSATSYVDMRCPQLNYTSVCNQYTFTLVGDDGSGSIEWYYGTNNEWTLIPNESGTTLEVEDISKLFTKKSDYTYNVKATVTYPGSTQSWDAVTAINKIFSLDLKAEKISGDDCEKVFELTASATKNFSTYSPNLQFFETGKSEAMCEGATPTCTTVTVTKNTSYYVTTSDGCRAETSVVVGCLKLAAEHVKCNEYTLKVTGSKGGVIKWETSADGQTWKEITGVTGTTYTVDIKDGNRFFKVAEGTLTSNVAEVVIYTLTLDADPAMVQSCGEEATLTATLNPSVQEAIYSFYRKGDTGAMCEGIDNSCSTGELYSNATFTVTVMGCNAETEVKVNLEWPTIFMPYTAGSTNQTFDVCAKNIKIFDRTGNMIADVDGNSWDGICTNGTAKGSIAMPAVYFYVATLEDGSTHKGSVEIYKGITTSK